MTTQEQNGKRPSNRRITTAEEIVKMSALFSLHLKKLADGSCRYDDGWNDETVATVVGVSATSVRTTRARLRYPYRAAKMDADATGLVELADAYSKIAALQLHIVSVEKKVDDLVGRLHKALGDGW